MSLFGVKEEHWAETMCFKELDGKLVRVTINNGPDKEGYINYRDEEAIVMTIPDNEKGDKKFICYRKYISCIEEV